jgi:hypothetical protein
MPKRQEADQDGSTRVVLKAHGGDRAKNLEGLAKEFMQLISDADHLLTPKDERRLKGYCEQLKIIAREIREGRSLFPTVLVYHSEADGVCVVDISTTGMPENEKGPILRVNVNDGDVYENPPYPQDVPSRPGQEEATADETAAD